MTTAARVSRQPTLQSAGQGSSQTADAAIQHTALKVTPRISPKRGEKLRVTAPVQKPAELAKFEARIKAHFNKVEVTRIVALPGVAGTVPGRFGDPVRSEEARFLVEYKPWNGSRLERTYEFLTFQTQSRNGKSEEELLVGARPGFLTKPRARDVAVDLFGTPGHNIHFMGVTPNSEGLVFRSNSCNDVVTVSMLNGRATRHERTDVTGWDISEGAGQNFAKRIGVLPDWAQS